MYNITLTYQEALTLAHSFTKSKKEYKRNLGIRLYDQIHRQQLAFSHRNPNSDLTRKDLSPLDKAAQRWGSAQIAA